MFAKIAVLAFLLSCAAPIFPLRLLYSNDRYIRLFSTNRTDGKERLVAEGMDSPVGVDFYYSDQLIFWTDVSQEKIFRLDIKIKRSSPEDIVSRDLVRPEGLAVDWLTRKIYWTDSYLKVIDVANFDGQNRKTLVWKDIDKPRAIAVDPSAGFMFWSEWGDTPKIFRAGMDGTRRTDLITTDITWPNGLTLDYKKSKLYWLDARRAYIASIDYYGDGRRIVYNGAVNHPYALTLFGVQLFWTEWDSDSIRSSIVSPKNASRTARVVKSRINTPMDLKVFEPERQPNVPSNPCGRKNGGCSHLCLLSPGGQYLCACPTGVSLLPNNKTCGDGPKKFLLLASSTEIRMLSLSTKEYRSVALPIANIRRVEAVEFDSVEKFVYWIDSHFHMIKRAHVNGSGELAVVKTGLFIPEGLVVDWINRRLYWTDAGTDLIEVSHLNGTGRKVFVSGNLDEPRAIAVDPGEGYLYWTDWGTHPKVERIHLNGSNREILVNNSIQWPNELVLDYTTRRLYWADGKLHKIEVCDFNGANRAVITDTGVPYIDGFALVGNYLYWTDAQRMIQRINKNNITDRETVMDVFGPSIRALKGVDLQPT